MRKFLLSILLMISCVTVMAVTFPSEGFGYDESGLSFTMEENNSAMLEASYDVEIESGTALEIAGTLYLMYSSYAFQVGDQVTFTGDASLGLPVTLTLAYSGKDPNNEGNVISAPAGYLLAVRDDGSVFPLSSDVDDPLGGMIEIPIFKFPLSDGFGVGIFMVMLLTMYFFVSRRRIQG